MSDNCPHCGKDLSTWLADKLAECGAQMKHRRDVAEAEVVRLNNPMSCGHFEVNLQPTDEGFEVCVVCHEIEKKLAEERARVWEEAANTSHPGDSCNPPNYLSTVIREIFLARAKSAREGGGA